MVSTRAKHWAHWWLIAAVPLAFLAMFFVWPLVVVAWRGLAGPGGLGGAADVLASRRTWSVVGTTLWLAAAGTLGSLVLGLPAAWALYRLAWRGQTWVRGLVVMPFVLPTVVVAAAFSALAARAHDWGTPAFDQSVGLIIAGLVFYNVSVVVRVVGGSWAALDPAAAAAARTLGASRARAWRAVTLSALMPAIGAASAVVALFCATAFGIVLVLGGTRVRTVETEIYIQVAQFLDLRAAAALSLLQLVLVGAALLAAAAASRRRQRGTSPDPRRGVRRATRADAWPAVLALTPVVLLVVAPMAALLERALRTRRGYGWDHFVALARPPQRSILEVPVWEAAANSLVTAAIAATLACTLGLAVTYLVTGRGGRSRFLDTLVTLPLGVSAVIVGLGLLLTSNQWSNSLRGAWWLVPIGQAVVALPLVVRTLTPSARAVAPRLRAAASSLGASPWRVWRMVDWPLLRRPFGLAVGFAFAISLGEFGATSFLARPDRPTLPTAIARLLGRPGLENVGTAYAAAIALAALTAVVMMTAERLRNDQGGAW